MLVLYVADLRPDVQLRDGVTHPWVFLLVPVHPTTDHECAEALAGSTVDDAYGAVLARIGRLVDRFHPRPIGVAWRHHGDHDRWRRLYTAHHLARLQADDLTRLEHIE